MNELCITIHNVTDTDHEALIRHIKRTLYDYDPELQVTQYSVVYLLWEKVPRY